jgi:hypothetical protein
MIGSESGSVGGYLEETATCLIYPDLAAMASGFQPSIGTLVDCVGEYRLSGPWFLDSGVTHADVIIKGSVPKVPW